MEDPTNKTVAELLAEGVTVTLTPPAPIQEAETSPPAPIEPDQVEGAEPEASSTPPDQGETSSHGAEIPEAEPEERAVMVRRGGRPRKVYKPAE